MSFSFLDFNYVDGAVDLFEETLRSSIKFNAMEDDVFEARVLTTPTKIEISADDSAPPDTNDKYFFRARILGPLSPHRFLEDPCELSNFQDEGAKERAFSVIQDHTKVVIYGEWENPSIGDVVKIKLERTGKTYNTKDAKQYLGITRNTTIPVKRTSGEDCTTLAEIFNGVDFNSLESGINSALIAAFEKDLKKAVEDVNLPFVVTSRTRTLDKQIELIKGKSVAERTKLYGSRINDAVENKNETLLRKLAANSSKHLKGAAIDIRTKHYDVNSSKSEMKKVLEIIRSLKGVPLLEPVSTDCWTEKGSSAKDPIRSYAPATGKCGGEHIHINIPTNYSTPVALAPEDTTPDDSET
jgi:hypothetical protein